MPYSAWLVKLDRYWNVFSRHRWMEMSNDSH